MWLKSCNFLRLVDRMHINDVFGRYGTFREKLPKELNPTKILHKYMDDYYTDKTKEKPPTHRAHKVGKFLTRTYDVSRIITC